MTNKSCLKVQKGTSTEQKTESPQAEAPKVLVAEDVASLDTNPTVGEVKEAAIALDLVTSMESVGQVCWPWSCLSVQKQNYILLNSYRVAIIGSCLHAYFVSMQDTCLLHAEACRQPKWFKWSACSLKKIKKMIRKWSCLRFNYYLQDSDEESEADPNDKLLCLDFRFIEVQFFSPHLKILKRNIQMQNLAITAITSFPKNPFRSYLLNWFNSVCAPSVRLFETETSSWLLGLQIFHNVSIICLIPTFVCNQFLLLSTVVFAGWPDSACFCLGYIQSSSSRSI